MNITSLTAIMITNATSFLTRFPSGVARAVCFLLTVAQCGATAQAAPQRLPHSQSLGHTHSLVESRTALLPSGQQLAHAGVTRAKFQTVAAELEFFDIGAFLYDRPAFSDFTADASARPAPTDTRVVARYFQALGQVLDPNIPVAHVAPLCHDTDPKVRTLALAALFQRNDAHLLPLMVDLTGDTALTFPGHAALTQQRSARAGVGPPPQKLSVGDVANAMVNFYLGRAGYHYGAAGTSGEPGFADYWVRRREREFCASWFSVALDRASRGTLPTQPQYRSDIRAVRRRIDALPAADRDWTLLFLNGDYGSDALVSEAELVAAAKRRGADALLSVLRDRIPSTDPDVQHRASNDGLYQRLMGWILARAPELLRSDMADALLDCERWQRDYQKRHEGAPLITPAWPIAAARLRPERGHDILVAAWPRFQGEYQGEERVSLMSALAAVGDARDFGFISPWFFAPPPAKYDGTFSEGRQSEFLSRLPRQEAPHGTHQIVARLILDARFDGAKFWAVKSASELVNAWLVSPVVDIQKLYETSWLGDENDPKALAALAPVRVTLRQTSGKWLE